MSTEQSEREAFERWAHAEGYPTVYTKNAIGPDRGPVYDDPRTHAAWCAWRWSTARATATQAGEKTS